MNVMTNCSSFRSGYLCLPRFVGAGPHRHLQRQPRHVAALLPLLRDGESVNPSGVSWKLVDASRIRI